jgi:hypothetical protein
VEVLIMLCSTSKKFIYLKTIKTASTSVESFFERYCLDPSLPYSQEHSIAESITPFGVVSSRMSGINLGKDKFKNHMAAARVRDILGHEIFDSYHKFCVVRNPYDKAVSMYWWHIKANPAKRDLLVNSNFDVIREDFSKYLRAHAGAVRSDSEIYSLDCNICVDTILRYENLLVDLNGLCDKLGIKFDSSQLKKYKSGARMCMREYQDYYSIDDRKIIEKRFYFELNAFDYSF